MKSTFTMMLLAGLVSMGAACMTDEPLDDADLGEVELSLTTTETTIQTAHRNIKPGYVYDNTTRWNNQTLPWCAYQEVTQVASTGVWKHYACNAGKPTNLAIAGSSSATPGLNWSNTVAGWNNSAGHRQAILTYSKVGCDSIAPTQAQSKKLLGNSFPYCRIWSCAYTN